jgi:hypothetical protein
VSCLLEEEKHAAISYGGVGGALLHPSYQEGEGGRRRPRSQSASSQQELGGGPWKEHAAVSHDGGGAVLIVVKEPWLLKREKWLLSTFQGESGEKVPLIAEAGRKEKRRRRSLRRADLSFLGPLLRGRPTK